MGCLYMQKIFLSQTEEFYKSVRKKSRTNETRRSSCTGSSGRRNFQFTEPRPWVSGTERWTCTDGTSLSLGPNWPRPPPKEAPKFVCLLFNLFYCLLFTHSKILSFF